MISTTKENSVSKNARTADDDWRYAEKALEWHGWGSPVGLGILAVSTGFLFAAAGASVLFLHWAGLF
jgi:hypothetical protein